MNTSEGEHFDMYSFITKEARRTTFTAQLIMKHFTQTHVFQLLRLVLFWLEIQATQQV
jgi:hypothetical protein